MVTVAAAATPVVETAVVAVAAVAATPVVGTAAAAVPGAEEAEEEAAVRGTTYPCYP